MLVHSEFKGFCKVEVKIDEKFLNYSAKMAEIKHWKVFVTKRVVVMMMSLLFGHYI
jgi:hypothetical protein